MVATTSSSREDAAVTAGDAALRDAYARYLDCLNRQDLDGLAEHVADDVRYNGEPVGLAGYQRMLRDDVERIPDLEFRVDLLVVGDGLVAARLLFDCTPVGELFGVRVDGRRVRFSENVFYRYTDGRITDVRSVIDVEAVRAQAGGAGRRD